MFLKEIFVVFFLLIRSKRGANENGNDCGEEKGRKEEKGCKEKKSPQLLTQNLSFEFLKSPPY